MNNLVIFFNSNFFVALATILTIGGAIYLYIRQEIEKKQQIATTLVNDIRNAYEAIQTIKSSLVSFNIPEITVLPENNWNKYSYLFSKDLDQDELHSVNKFFSTAERINYIVTKSNNMFLLHITNRSAAMQTENLKKIAGSQTIEEAIENIKKFDEIFADSRVSNSPYMPQGFSNKLSTYLSDVQDLLNSSAGIKLKKIALNNLKTFFSFNFITLHRLI